ncbi:DUF5704 domain-containing protein [Paenibacillus xylanexedens]|uniref:DUF5704 domain-containing protein n=1 Tax=Paenibacillus xylanexedens TaxID=528191 RepID=UPI003D036DAD
MKKYVFSVLFTLIIVYITFALSYTSYANFNKGYPNKGIEVNPSGLAKGKQSIKVMVTGTASPHPMTVWTQGDGDIWSATRNEGADRVTTTTYGSGADAVPRGDEFVKDKINTQNYVPASLGDDKQNLFRRPYVKSLGIEDINYVSAPSYTVEPGSKPEYEKGNLFAILKTKTGYPKQATKKEPYGGVRPDGHRKYQATYDTPLKIEYSGYVTETKEIRVREDMQLQVNDVKSLVAEIRTKQYDQEEFGNWVNVSKRADQIEWSSNKQNVVYVEPKTGQIVAKNIGTAIITAKWKNSEDGPYHIYENVTITVGDTPPPEIPETPDAACTESPAGEMTGERMDPNASAVIKADQRGSEPFDVLRGIPTSESLYGNVFGLSYLFQNKFVNMQGTCTYNVVVEKTYNKTWTDEKKISDGKGGTTTVSTPRSRDVKVPYSYTVKRDFEYWKIDTLLIYEITDAILKNYALPQIELYPADYRSPIYAAATNGTFYAPNTPAVLTAPSQPVPGGTSEPPTPIDDLSSIAEDAVPKVQVKNDYLKFNGAVVMDNAKVEETGPTPGQIAEPQMIGKDVLYSPDNEISKTLLNKKDTPSTGEIRYELMSGNVNDGNEEETFEIPGINTVTVHTPVVNYSLVSDDQPHNQKTIPNMARSALILERPFTVRIPTSGQHLDVNSYPGYGDRDYAKYYRIKQVRFPFDVYSADRTQFYPRSTWIDIPVDVLDTTFYLPVWVDEGDYQVEFRNIAENAPADFESMSRSNAQPDANTDLTYHLASDEVSVEVIGRLYDFEITDIADYNWELVFRRFKGSIAPTWISYWTGTQGIDGDKRGNKPQFTVPIRPGSHPLQGYQNVAVKTGYHFKFDFKTKGNMFGPRDGIRLTPTFDFVSKDGKTRVPVDLYYSTNQRSFIRIGSAEDQVKRFVILNDRLRQVPSEQLRDTATYKYNRYGEIHPGMMSERTYQEYYRDKFTKMKTPVGGYSLLLMPEQLRTFIGPKTNIPTNASADVLRANAAIQQWYGEYSLPAEPDVVQAGTNLAEYGRTHGGLDATSPIFLKNGYIVVNFNLESIQEGNLRAPHLQYIHAPLMNQWLLEGFQRQVEDSYGNSFTLRDGDVVFYHADRSSRDDFSAQVPH